MARHTREGAVGRSTGCLAHSGVGGRKCSRKIRRKVTSAAEGQGGPHACLRNKRVFEANSAAWLRTIPPNRSLLCATTCTRDHRCRATTRKYHKHTHTHKLPKSCATNMRLNQAETPHAQESRGASIETFSPFAEEGGARPMSSPPQFGSALPKQISSGYFQCGSGKACSTARIGLERTGPRSKAQRTRNAAMPRSAVCNETAAGNAFHATSTIGPT